MAEDIPFIPLQVNNKDDKEDELPFVPLDTDAKSVSVGETLANTGKSLASGTMSLVGGINALPSVLARAAYNAAAIPQNLIADAVGREDLKVSFDKNIADVPGIKQVDEFFTGGAKKAFDVSNELSTLAKYDKDMLTNFKEGNWSDLGGQLFYSTVETVPQLAAMYLTAGLSGGATASNMIGQSATKAAAINSLPSAVIGGSAAGSEFIETEDNENLTENERIVNALAKGGAEGLWEQVWTLPMINKLAQNDVVREPLEKGFKNAALNYGKDFVKSALGEAVEEMGTEATNIATDVAVGKKAGDVASRIFSAGAGALLPGGLLGGGQSIQQNIYMNNMQNVDSNIDTNVDSNITDDINAPQQQETADMPMVELEQPADIEQPQQMDTDTTQQTSTNLIETGNTVNTEKFGKLNIIDANDTMITAENERGNTLRIGREALENNIIDDTPTQPIQTDISEDTVVDDEGMTPQEMEAEMRSFFFGEDNVNNVISEQSQNESMNIPQEEITLESREQPIKPVNIDNKKVNMNIEAIQPNRADYITDTDMSIELPEIVEISKEINEGKTPSIVKGFKDNATDGQFVVKNKEGKIELRSDLFIGPRVDEVRLKPSQRESLLNELQSKYTDNEYKIDTYIDNTGKEYARVYKRDRGYAPKVLAHEIGHLVDWLPDKVLNRGNILGRVASLKEYMKQTIKNTDVNRDQLMAELKELSQKWKPFDPNQDGGYTEYRYHPAELYADAMSVLINNPEMLQNTAPNFYKAFMDNLDKKPKFKASYEDVRRRMKNRKNLTSQRAEKATEGYIKGLEKRQQMLQEESEPRVESGVLALKRSFADQNADILQHIEKYLREDGEAGDIARKARNMLEEMPYLSSEIDDYYYQVSRNIIESADNTGIDINQLGLFLRYNRILNDRQDIANPGGTDANVAVEQIESMKNDLGTDKYNKLVELANKFYDLRTERVVSRIEESGMFDPELVEHIKNNREYVTFSIIDYLDSKHGEGTGSGIYRQYGTFKQEENPFVATLLKDASLLASININEAKQSAIVALKEFSPNTITEAPTKYDANVQKMVPEKPADKNMELFTLMVEGELASYHVPREIANTFKHDPYTANTVTNVINKIMQGIKELWVSKNPGWMIFNVPRDFMNTVMNNPEIRIRDIPKLANEYRKATADAWKEVRRGERSQDISDMRRNRMLTIDRMYRPKDFNINDEVANTVYNILNKINPEEIQQSNQAVESMKKVWNFLGDLGQVSEMSGKIGGYRFLRNNTDLATEELAHRVRTRVGTPDFKRRGKWHRATNNICVFSNIRKEGYRAAFESFKDNPATYIWKTTMLSILPKLMQLALENADKLLPGNDKAEEIAKIMEGISSYKKENYLTIPLGRTEQGKSIAATLPQGFIEQYFSGVLYNLTKGDTTRTAESTLEQLPYSPSNINPLIKFGWDLYNYSSGRNVYDMWYGRNMISEDAMQLGGLDKLKEFSSYEAKSMGLSTIIDQNYQYADTSFEKLLNIFPLNALGRYIEISDYGFKEDINKIYEDKEKASAIVNKYKDQLRKNGKTNIDKDTLNDALYKNSYYNSLARTFSGLRRQMKYIEDSNNLSEEEKKQRVNQIEQQMINMARQALGKEPIDFNE